MYDYRKAIAEDIRNYIDDNVDLRDYEDRNEAEQALQDDLWTVDSVTGNGSGSYTFNSARAREYVLDDMDACTTSLREYGADAVTVANHFLEEDWEWFDVTIRCYLLGEVLSGVLDEYETAGVWDEDEEPEEDRETIFGAAEHIIDAIADVLTPAPVPAIA